MQRGYNQQREAQAEDLTFASGTDWQETTRLGPDTLILDEPSGDFIAQGGTPRNMERQSRRQQSGNSRRTEPESPKGPFGDKTGLRKDINGKWYRDLRLHKVNNEPPTSMPFVPASRGSSRHAMAKIAKQKKEQEQQVAQQQRERAAKSAPPRNRARSPAKKQAAGNRRAKR
mmetsp:Transcript_109152/g.188901  ORF Transcript_109152/g.188901 Transcript_109152/m.188901 type:complete len:172 (+) Transcript_109152:1-516(+)